MTITDADRQATDAFYKRAADVLGPVKDRPSDGPQTFREVMDEAFSRHRIATIEECARVAEQWLEPIMATPHENDTYRSIATAIRKLGE